MTIAVDLGRKATKQTNKDADRPYVRKSIRKCVTVALTPNTLAHVYCLCIRNIYIFYKKYLP